MSRRLIVPPFHIVATKGLTRTAVRVSAVFALSLGLGIGCNDNGGSQPKTGGTGGGASQTGGKQGGANGTGGSTSSNNPAAAGGSAGMSATGGSPAGGTGSGGSPQAGGQTISGGVGGAAGGAVGGSPGSGGAQGGAGGVGVPASNTEVVGWAATSAGGIEKTTGGGTATPVSVTTMADLSTHAGGTDPKVIHVSGQLSGTLTVGSNKTIIGMSGAQISDEKTLRLVNSKNVIIKNIKFVGKPVGTEDSGLIENSQHIWIDHVEFLDSGKGLLDILGSSDFITISWTKFGYTTKAADHNAMVMGMTNEDAASIGKMNLTMHHNWWAENINERMPRARFGKVHLFNNLYTATPAWTYYAVRPGAKANVRSENNIYKDFKGPSYSKSVQSFAFSYHDSPEGILQSIGDLFVNCTEKGVDLEKAEAGTMSRGTAFTPTYPYKADPTDGLEAAIRSGAGPR